jgi:hypothetical protein
MFSAAAKALSLPSTEKDPGISLLFAGGWPSAFGGINERQATVSLSEICLLLHGAFLLLAGLGAGFPFGRAILRADAEAERAWRVAHSSLSMGGTTLIAVAAVIWRLPDLAMVSLILVISFVASAYGFALALLYGPLVRQRGLSNSGPVSNRLVFAGNFVGAAGSLIGAVSLCIWVLWALVMPARG